MDRRNWKDCPTSLTHGNIIQRVIFTKEDPANPRKEGAIMRFVESFARGYLEPGVRSVPHVNEDIQEVFFVAGGSGVLVTGDQQRPISEGDGIYMPPGIEHTFVNNGADPLELLILVESIPAGTTVSKRESVVRNYRETNLGQGHWNHIVHGVITRDDGLTRLGATLVVRIEPMQTSDNHGHGTDMDEIWYMWKGHGVHVVSQEVCVQTPGTAIAVAPSNPGHSLINHTDEPLQVFYFAAR